MAFKDNIGEFAMEAYPVEQGLTNKEDFFRDILDIVVGFKNIKLDKINNNKINNMSIIEKIREDINLSSLFLFVLLS